VTHDSNGAPRVYIVLVNWNGADDTIECLDSLFDLDYPNFRVVVCDNASTDGSVERITRWVAGEERFARPAESPLAGRALQAGRLPTAGIVELDRAAAERGDGHDEPLTVIQTGDNLGFAGGNNVGLRWVRARGDGDYVWLLNNDTVVDPDALTAQVRTAGTLEEGGVVGSCIAFYSAPDVVQAMGGGTLSARTGRVRLLSGGTPLSRRGDHPGSVSLDFVHGASMLLPVRLLERIGLLDESFFLYYEDAAWSLRARQAGHPLACACDSIVWHKEGASVGRRSPLHDYYVVRNGTRILREMSGRTFTIGGVLNFLGCFSVKLVRFQWPRAMAVLCGYRDYLLGRTGAWGGEVR
jgi:GT2 family glycosyltransferase